MKSKMTKILAVILTLVKGLTTVVMCICIKDAQNGCNGKISDVGKDHRKNVCSGGGNNDQHHCSSEHCPRMAADIPMLAQTVAALLHPPLSAQQSQTSQALQSSNIRKISCALSSLRQFYRSLTKLFLLKYLQ